MLPLIFTLALAPSTPVTPADGTYQYTSRLNGQNLGTTTIIVKHSAGGISVGETAAASVGGSPVAANTTAQVDPKLAPTSYDANYVVGARKIHSALVFKGATATQSSDAPQLSGKSYNLSADAKGFVILDGALVGGFFLLPAQMALLGNGPVDGIAPSYGQAFSIAVDPTAKPARPANVPAGDLSLSVGSPLPFTEWYDPKTMLLDELDVPSQSIVVTRTK